MNIFKSSYFLIAFIVLLGLLVSLPGAASVVSAQSGSREERLNDPDLRLYFWQLERDGIQITKEDRLYRVVNGDTLTSIAARYDITVDHLVSVNPQINAATMLLRGELIHIPHGITENSPPFYQTPVVVVGGSNGSNPPNAVTLLRADALTRLILWQLEGVGIVITQEDRLYRVVTGDTLYKIAGRYGLTLEKLIAANPQINDLNVILRGELIYIPEGITETSPPFYTSPQPVSK